MEQNLQKKEIELDGYKIITTLNRSSIKILALKDFVMLSATFNYDEVQSVTRDIYQRKCSLEDFYNKLNRAVYFSGLIENNEIACELEFQDGQGQNKYYSYWLILMETKRYLDEVETEFLTKVNKEMEEKFEAQRLEILKLQEELKKSRESEARLGEKLDGMSRRVEEMQVKMSDLERKCAQTDWEVIQ